MEVGIVDIIAALGLAGGFLVTVVTVAWKMSALAGRVEKNESSARLAHERLDKYVLKHESAIEELKQRVNSILQTQVRIEEKLSFLIDRNNN